VQVGGEGERHVRKSAPPCVPGRNGSFTETYGPVKISREDALSSRSSTPSKWGVWMGNVVRRKSSIPRRTWLDKTDGSTVTLSPV
jgi:hypothetical protein